MFPVLLVVVPLIASVLLLFTQSNGARKIIVKLSALAIGALSVVTAATYLNKPAVLHEGITFNIFKFFYGKNIKMVSWFIKYKKS